MSFKIEISAGARYDYEESNCFSLFAMQFEATLCLAKKRFVPGFPGSSRENFHFKLLSSPPPLNDGFCLLEKIAPRRGEKRQLNDEDDDDDDNDEISSHKPGSG